MYCEPSFGGSQKSACRQVLEHYALESVSTSELHGRRYGVFRLTGRASGNSTAPGCPFVAGTPR